MIDRRPRLLIVGGLTIDRFPDGSSAPGGSVVHAGRAAVAEGASLAILTVAGDEPEAAIGLAQLAEMGDLVHQRAPSTVTYRHDEVDGHRVLTYLASAAPIAPPTILDSPDVAILAPIADELPATALVPVRDAVRPRLSVLLIQGWLRRLVIGEPVRPLSLDEVGGSTWRAFADADAIVVSTEDLAESPDDPFGQAADLRARLGPHPLLVLTLGEQGYILDDPAADRVIASVPRRVIRDVPMVGAGDTFGAVLAIHLGRGAAPEVAAVAATEAVIRMLESRRS
jgi:sugar/nucleoside kinase (ribokinase family)